MDVKSLDIKNFLTIGSASLELDNRGLLLIQGINGDDSSAKSNGAGKSSIVDALCWAVYGETARGVSGDKVVNNKAKKECEVAVVLVDGDREYRIVRYRKHKTGKNSVTVSERDLTTGIGSDLSKGTDKETQEVIDKIMGCSLEVFKGAIYAGQEAMPDLPGMTDKHLKLLIEEAAGVEILAEAYKEAAARALGAERDWTTAATHAKSLRGNLESMRDGLRSAEEQHALFEDGRKDRARAELALVKPAQEAIDGLRKRLDEYDETTLAAAAAELQGKLGGHKAHERELDRLTAAVATADKAVAQVAVRLQAAKQELARSEAALDALNSQVGQPCGECGKPYCEHDLETARTLREAKIGKDKKAVLEVAAEARAAVAVLNEAKTAATTYRAGMPDVTEVASKLARVNGELSLLAATKGHIARYEGDIERIKGQAKAKLTEPNPWAKTVETKKADIAKMEGAIITADADAAALEERYLLHKDAASVFGPAGVRAHILDTVTPFLNERTSEYLGTLADGNITATWSTLARSAKGELKEKFNIEVVNDHGGDTFAAQSGGEKRKVRLATNLALQDMVASRAEKPINLWIGDEIDDALDEAGLERLMAVLEKKAKERGTVLVISHHALTDWIDNVITVTKEDGQSVVAGATHRGF